MREYPTPLDLHRCPYCKTRVHIIYHIHTLDSKHKWTTYGVTCTQCNRDMGHVENGKFVADEYKTEAEAILDWNSRTLPNDEELDFNQL